MIFCETVDGFFFFFNLLVKFVYRYLAFVFLFVLSWNLYHHWFCHPKGTLSFRRIEHWHKDVVRVRGVTKAASFFFFWLRGELTLFFWWKGNCFYWWLSFNLILLFLWLFFNNISDFLRLDSSGNKGIREGYFFWGLLFFLRLRLLFLDGKLCTFL